MPRNIYRAKYSGKVYNTREEAIADNRKHLAGEKKMLSMTSKRNQYVVQKGDTLSKISKLTTGNSNNYTEIAKASGIKNPNIIYPGQKITIPEKFNKPLKFKEIPTNNRLSIIDDYSPNYNYIVEKDKIYYSKKGNNDYWVDISDNEVARKNLYNHIGSKYDYRGYEDDERQIGELIKNNKYNYHDEYAKQNAKTASFKQKFSLKDPEVVNYTHPNSSTQVARILNSPITKEPQENKNHENSISNLFQKGINYLTRQYEKLIGDNDAQSNIVLPKSINADSKYNIVPDSYTGDTIKVNDRQYIIPESIDLNSVRLGVRNRGDRTPLKTEGAVITAFNKFVPYESVNKNDTLTTYIGTDKNGKFKAGNIKNFTNGDYISRTFENKVTSFAKDSKGNQIWKDDAVHGNPGRNVPVINVIQNGKQIKGSLNLLTNKNSNDNTTYGNITGGRVILKAGNETRLVSGSIADIEKQFNDIKKRHGANSVLMYTLDAGSYNRGLRTYDKIISAQDQINYDNQNNGGGNFMYLLDSNNVFPSDTINTPNIRTKDSESYKKGHPLVNEQKGVVLHHTAFMEPDLTNVTKHLTNPNTEASSHAIIGYDGKRRVLATPDKITYHAGQSVWNNRDNVNDFMIGVEFQGDTNKKDLTPQQIQSVVEYLKPIIRQNNISLENITTHEQVRKLYNDFAKKQNAVIAPNKPDINQRNYQKIINELLRQLYYEKPNIKNNNQVRRRLSNAGKLSE